MYTEGKFIKEFLVITHEGTAHPISQSLQQKEKRKQQITRSKKLKVIGIQQRFWAISGDGNPLAYVA